MGHGARALEGVAVSASSWRGTSVFMTGHTGFKGGWLALMLAELGAKVHGLALEPPIEPSLFATARIADRLTSHVVADVLDLGRVRAAMAAARPSVVFHLAAQPLVRRSYREPVDMVCRICGAKRR
jgi:CDP-glucose 4,6-dehydratase